MPEACESLPTQSTNVSRLSSSPLSGRNEGSTFVLKPSISLICRWYSNESHGSSVVHTTETFDFVIRSRAPNPGPFSLALTFSQIAGALCSFKISYTPK
ncbi:hypothetical protein D1872_269330 [compost metagenome]